LLFKPLFNAREFSYSDTKTLIAVFYQNKFWPIKPQSYFDMGWAISKQLNEMTKRQWGTIDSFILIAVI